MATTSGEPTAAPGALIEVRLTAIHYAARDTNLFEFRRLDGAPLPPYEPGAHVDVHLPSGHSRSYSLIVARPEPDTYTFGIKRDPASRGGSRFMHDELRVGRTIKISAPRNNFPLKEDASHSVLIAGGIGITPIRCMVQRLLERERSFALHYACRSRADAAFLHELQDVAGASFHFDDENEGRFLDVAGIVASAPKEAHLYCCGPTPMLNAFEAATRDWPRAQIHVEYFTPKEEPVQGQGWLHGRARTLGAGVLHSGGAQHPGGAAR